jgi:hypothetical protein
MERAELEREADHLAISWQDSISDEQLQILIEAKNIGIDLSEYGDLPECFGQSWDGECEEVCQGCVAQGECFVIFARIISQADGSPAELAEALEVSMLSITRALDSVKENLPKREPESEPEPEPESEPGVKAPEPALYKRGRKRPPPKKRKSEPPESVSRPPMAQSATPAAVLGVTGSRSAENAKGLVDQQVDQKVPWGLHTWKARRLREQKRSKWIAMLSPGERLVREWRGVVHCVVVRRDSYLYQNEGKAYPTLYAVTKRITGEKDSKWGRKLCNWSAAKFWNLKKNKMSPGF